MVCPAVKAKSQTMLHKRAHPSKITVLHEQHRVPFATRLVAVIQENEDCDVVTKGANQHSGSGATGVYFQNCELAKTMHPLQAPPSSVSCSGDYQILPSGKPLSPPPALGHLCVTSAFKKSGGKIHFSPPVEFSKTRKHRVFSRNISYSKLNAEEQLFLEAAASLRKVRAPPVRKSGLPPSPFTIAFAA
jgi:hypothetical protein